MLQKCYNGYFLKKFYLCFMEDKIRVLVVDDEESLCEILQFNLEMQGYDVDIAYSAEQALKYDLGKYSLLLLDVMMGDMSGFDLAKRIKGDILTQDLPIIFCTAKDAERDTLKGFELGADDYISKPFSIKEVLARVKSVLRRTSVISKKFIHNTLVVDKTSMRCFIDDQEIFCTKKEMEILLLLISNKNKIFSREEIMSIIWREDSYVFDRTIDVNITRLRKKLGVYGKNIVTRQGYGYGFKI